jgi:hypothetical protein
MDVTCNPHGVLYNPESIAMALEDLLAGRRYDAGDVEAGTICRHEPSGRYYSFNHHGSLSAETPEALCAQLNEVEDQAARALQRAQHLFITFGTAWVYTRDGRVVANCHQFPASTFERRRLTVDAIVNRWCELLDRVPQPHVLFTVSPIRYVKETLHGNQLSKATLLLAVDELVRCYPGRVEYLPAYELLVDDLRDYRYYASDLVHPSDLAVEVVREYFQNYLMTPHCRQYLHDVEPLLKALQHRPFHPESAVYQAFIAQNTLKIEQLIEKYHIFTLDLLKQQFQERISNHHDSPVQSIKNR